MTRHTKTTVLIIDDDHDFVEATRAYLSRNNYEVLTAYSGADGIEKAMSRRPDVIVLDVIMPEQDGFKVCRQLKGRYAGSSKAIQRWQMFR